MCSLLAELSNTNLQRNRLPHSITEQSKTAHRDGGRTGKSCSVLLKTFLLGNEGKKNHSINPKQFPPICQHMVGAIIIWLKYKVSSSLFFYFNSLTFRL